VYSEGTLYTPLNIPRPQNEERSYAYSLRVRGILTPISRPKNPPLLHFMIYAYLEVPPHPRPLILGYAPTMGLYTKPNYLHMPILPYYVFFSTPTHWFHTMCSFAPLHIQVAIFGPSPILLVIQIFYYFWVVISRPYVHVSFLIYFLTPKFERIIEIVPTNLRGAEMGRRLEEIWWWECDNTTHGYVWQNIHIATPSKDRHGFSLTRTVTQQGERTT